MSMKALNQLVARSIVDPAIVQAFSSGQISEVLEDLEFEADLHSKLSGLEAETWAEFAVLAYRTVKAAEAKKIQIDLPSPAEGLFPSRNQDDQEQVA